MKKILSVLVLLLLSRTGFSQEIKKGDIYNYARNVVDTMASPAMHGRGYVLGGDSIAAHYISKEFKNAGLRSFGTDYYQHLSFDVNTFPEVKRFYWQGIEELVIGKDFIISPSSGSAQSNSPMSKVVWLDSTTLNNPLKFKRFLKKRLDHSYLAIDVNNKRDEEIKAVFEKSGTPFRGLIFIRHNKLTADFEQRATSFPSVELLIHEGITTRRLKKGAHADLSFENKLVANHGSQNVIGYIEGSVQPDSFIVFSAHYDHIGQMGTALFPGANDNASGCAMLLNLAKYYGMPANRPKCSVIFMAFCGEEVGLLGSKYFTEHPLVPLRNIKFLLNMDIMGTGEDGITVVNGSVFKKEFEILKDLNIKNGLIKEVRCRGKAANSDHFYFSEKGVKSFFIYTLGGIKAYHDIYDRPETLPLNEFEDLFVLIRMFCDKLQGVEL